MADQEQVKTGTTDLWDKEMEIFKVRVYTQVPPNATLVGYNLFTKKPFVSEKRLFNLPWTKSRFITMQNQNMDLASQRYEIGSDGLEIVSNIALTYRVKPIEKTTKPTLKQRWRRALTNFTNNPVKSVLKVAGVAAVMIAAGAIVGPGLALGVLAASTVGTAGYISFAQDKKWVAEQGSYQAAFNSKAAMQTLEQIIYNELRHYYATQEYQEIRENKLSLSSPMLTDLRERLAAYGEQYGIEVTNLNIKSADLTPESNTLLQKRKESKVKAAQIREEADARSYETETRTKAEADSITAYYKQLVASGMPPREAAEIVRTKLLSDSGANVILNGMGGGVIPTVSVGGGPRPESPEVSGDERERTR